MGEYDKKRSYRGISISEELAERIKALVAEGTLGYNSSTDFITEAVRLHLDHMEDKNLQLKKLKKELTED
jgi:Arc/MetJ-type ribon-helix-helix transcriptional regulator